MTSTVRARTAYMLGKTTAEHVRLTRQGRLIANLTQHFLQDAGLRPGMRVLDLGSGAGDVALLAARMVAREGQVVGIDLDESALRLARQRAYEHGLRNVEFYNGDFLDYIDGNPFDAVVGRCVLLHQHNPAKALSAASRHVRSAGIVAFQEPWFSRGFSSPTMPLFEEVIGWLHASVRASGLDGEIGLRLASIFSAVGLPAPRLTFEMLVECSPASEIWDFVADTVRSLLPRLEYLGVTDAARVQLDTLADRLRRQQADLGSVVGIMPLMGAWCGKP